MQPAMTLIENTLVAWLKSVSGQVVINERNPGPRPDAAYLSMLLFRQEGTSWPTRCRTISGSVMTEKVSDPTYFGMMLTARGKGAQSTLNKIRLGLRSDNRYRDLYQIIGLGGCGDVQNTATAFAGRILEQASMEVTFYALLSYEEAVDYFEAVEVDVEGDDELVLTIP
jgi:hypothetical protein